MYNTVSMKLFRKLVVTTEKFKYGVALEKNCEKINEIFVRVCVLRKLSRAYQKNKYRISRLWVGKVAQEYELNICTSGLHSLSKFLKICNSFLLGDISK